MMKKAPSKAQEKYTERQAKKRLVKKEKYAKAFVSTARAASDSASAASSKKLKKTSYLDDAYSRAGVNGNYLSSAGKRLFENAIVSMDGSEFFSEIHEKDSLLHVRNDPSFNLEWLSVNDLRTLLNSGKVTSDDATVSKWEPETGRKSKPFSTYSWESDFSKGWSIRLLRPQTENDKLWRMCSLLESYWGQSAGINCYWTPKGSQGFAPHYDDVDVFILQTEGKKRWVVYSPSQDGDERFPHLPLESSMDFELSELEGLEKKHDVVLSAGDMLYLPRGWIHYAESLEDEDSLHVTVSMGSNRVTWGSLIEKMVFRAVRSARLNHVDLRESLPHGFEQYMGAEHADQKDDIRRDEFELKALTLFKQFVVPELDADIATDDVIGDLMHDRHRPAREDDVGVEDDDDEVDMDRLGMKSVVELKVAGAARICIENGLAVVRHCMKNTRLFHEVDERGIEFDLDDAPTIEAALNNTDGPFTISSLPEVLFEEGEEPEEYGGRVRVVAVMISEGILKLVKY